MQTVFGVDPATIQEEIAAETVALKETAATEERELEVVINAR